MSTQTQTPNNPLEEFEQASIQPYYDCTRNGVYYIAIETDSNGNIREKPPLRLSDAVRIIGRGTDTAGNHYRVISWQDGFTHKARIAALPMADIGTNAGFQSLQQRGITVHAGRRKRELLADYLQTQGDSTPFHIVDKAGWHGKDYILPSGEIIHSKQNDKDKSAPKTLYNGDTSQAAAFTISGSLKEWQEQVSQYAAGNSRLCLAIGTALAAPLLAILGEQNGGFHIYGKSSDGKTTAAKVGLSVWGQPEKIKNAWNGTVLGFANAALARNDNFMVLDEIAECEPHIIAKTTYSVINGKSKLQGAKDGGNRQQSEWRILIFSTGEYDLKNYIERGGMKWEAGQSVRLPSLPAMVRYGVYDHLHGFHNGAALSDHLLNAMERQHGAAGAAWVEKLMTLDMERIHAARDAFMQILPELNGQALRAARRFAIVAAALELANEITGLAAGVGMAGVKQCFDDWFSINGSMDYETRTVIEQTEKFMQLYGESGRFVEWYSHYTNYDHAGYFRELNEKEKRKEFWIVPAVFESEILRHSDVQQGCLVLHKVGWLQKPKSGKGWKQLRFQKGRYYVLLGMEPPNLESLFDD